jgi:hypothetical protein
MSANNCQLDGEQTTTSGGIEDELEKQINHHFEGILLLTRNIKAESKNILNQHIQSLREIFESQKVMFESAKLTQTSQVTQETSVDQLRWELNEFKDEMRQLLRSPIGRTRENSRQTTFADVARRDNVNANVIENSREIQMRENSVVLVYPTDPSETSHQLENKLKDKLKAEKIKVGIPRVKHVSKNGVLLFCDTKESCGKIVSELEKEMKGQVKANIPVDKKPLIQLSGITNLVAQVTRDVTDMPVNAKEKDARIAREITRKIFYRYPQVEEAVRGGETIHFKFMRRKDGVAFGGVWEVSKGLRKILFELKRLCLNFETIYCDDFNNVVKCFKCLRFNHMKESC